MGAIIAATTFPYDRDFVAVIECVAGQALHGTGARYAVQINVVDFSTMTSIIGPSIVAEGYLSDDNWPEQAQQFVFPMPEPGVANEGHICKIFASLKVGVSDPYVSLAESPLFLIAAP
jgi:hypothetical protein